MFSRRGKAGSLVGVVLMAVIAAATFAAPPAYAAECRDNAGWWCLYGDPGLQGMLIGTNNPGADVELIGKFGRLNDRADSAINRTSSHMGLYEHAGFKKLIVCMPPNSTVNQLPSDQVTSIRMRPGRADACGAAAATKPSDPEPEADKRAPAGKPKASRSAGKPDGASSSEPAASPPDAKPTAEPPATPDPTFALPELAAPNQAPPATPMSATSDDEGGVGAGTIIMVIVAIGVIALLAVLALVGILLRGRSGADRREDRDDAVPPSADPESTRRVDRALRLLAVDCEQEGREPPAVRTVLLEGTDLTLVLAAPDDAAPQPWRADGDRWRLAVSDITELTDDVGPHRPFPLLVAVRPGTWVNLAETPGPIALDGARRNARRAAQAMSGLLRGSPWSDGVRIRMIGFDGAAADASDGTESGRVAFIDDGHPVPATVPAGCAVIAVGRVPGARTTWPVRSGGALVIPAVPAAPAAVSDAADDAAPAAVSDAADD